MGKIVYSTTNCNAYFSLYSQIFDRNRMPITLSTYAKYLIDLYVRCIDIYLPLIKSLQSTM